MSYVITNRNPSVQEYLEIRKQAGMKPRDPAFVERGLKNSLFSVCVELNGHAVGMGRLVGDGGSVVQIVDIAVCSEHQKKGLGRLIMDELMKFIHENTHPTTFVNLIADLGAKSFYERYGFQARGSEEPGMFLHRPLV